MVTRRQGQKRKAAAAVDETPAESPVTPVKRRTTRKSAVLPLMTPTLSAVGPIAKAADKNKSPKKPRAAAVDRLADPKTTNAPLLSPETSRVVASKTVDSISPSKVSKVKTTTANILEEACAHLIKVDARMKPLIDAHHCKIFSPEGLAEKIDPFERLASGIISQQVSGAAAKSIKNKFISLFADQMQDSGRFPHPSQVAPTSIERLRTAGLSQRKAEYIQGLAEKFVSGELSAQLLADAPYEEVLEKLIAVRGLGRWSVEMFATFGLKRFDVFSLGDLGQFHQSSLTR
jgi:DNA-3-methyladenine glycosylase II